MKLDRTLIKLLLLASLFIQYACSASEKLISIEIVYEDFFTETIERIDCSSFEKAFQNLEHIKVDNKETLRKVEKLAANFSQENEQLDVRGILIMNYDNKQIKYCFDRYGYFERSGVSFKNKQLFKILDEKINFTK